MRNRDSLGSEAPGIDPAAPPMRGKEWNKKNSSQKSVVAQQLEIVVMHVNRIGLDRFPSKLPAVKLIRLAAGSENRIHFPLVERRLPQLEPHIFLINDSSRAVGQKIAFL